MFLLAAARLPAAENLLANPGFEDGDANWIIKEQTPISQISADAAHTGSSGLRIDDQSEDDSASVITERFDVGPGALVRVSFWARSQDAPFTGVKLALFNDENRWATDDDGRVPGVTVTDASGQWILYSFECRIPDRIRQVAITIRTWSGAKGSADFDDFSLTID